MSHQAPVSTSLIYLYVGSEWSGPFQVEQIRFFRHHGQVESDTYAYDPDGQRHYTVGELLAAADAGGLSSDSNTGNAHHDNEVRLEGTELNSLVARDLDDTSTPSTTRIFLAADDISDPTATIGTSLDALPDPLRTFFRTFRELTEGRPSDRAQTQAHLHEMASSIGIQLSAAISDPATLQAIVDDVVRMADYLANRLQDNALWEAIDALRGFKPETDADESVMAARQVISCLVDRAAQGKISRNTSGLVPVIRDRDLSRDLARDHTRDVKPRHTDSQEIKAVSDSWDQPHARTARIIMRDARKELKSTEADLEAIQHAYAELQAAHTRDLNDAREMLASLESARADEVANAAQAMAEVRSLAAEIHRLAEETLIGEDDLKGEIRQLADELKGHDATAMAPLAEALLIRLVARLRNLVSEPGVAQVPGEVGLLREDLAKVRGELVGARAQVLVLTDERDRLKRQLDEQRAAADRAIANSKEREQRLRSTVTALEVTKDLHQDVMRELDVQLTTAQKRVGEMESELFSVRGELSHTRTHLADRTQELQSEMRRAVELQAMLEARRVELSGHLKDAEAQLMQAQVAQSTPGAEVDPELMEALAAKVNHLRTMFEATKRRLDEQQQVALKLEEELTASRREASELRGRSDALTGELDDARVGLAAAKKRFEELNRAYSRLESERESLQQELTQRKGTDSLRKGSNTFERPTESARNDQSQSGTTRMNKVLEALETRLSETQRKLEQANAHLESERRRVQELTLSHSQFQVRVDDLTADRDHVRLELDKLHSEHFSEHSRHAASIAVATQSTIDAERRVKDAIARQIELEDQVDWLQKHQQPADAALQQLSAEGDDHTSGQFVSPAQVQKLVRELDEARAELQRLQALQAGSASGQRHALTVRLAQLEGDLVSATTARDESTASLQSTVAERDRLSRELGRLRGEHESAAVEHRASLKAARDKLGESQARVQVLEKELEQLHAQPAPADPKIAERAAEHSAERISELVAERGRLTDQVRDLTATISRGGIAEEMPALRRQLDQELERIQALTRSLAETQSQSDLIRARVSELEGRATNSQHERDQLQIEVERLKGELLLAQAHAGISRDSDHGRRSHMEAKLHEVLADREQLLGELSRVNADLMQVRGRLIRAESESLTAERLPNEYARVRDLESQISQLRTEQQSTTSELAKVRARLTQTTSERDQLQDEVTRLKAQLAQVGVNPHHHEELAQLREKLVRAKMRIRALRKERDDLLAKVGGEAATGSTGVVPLTTSRIGSTLTAGEPRGFTSRTERPVTHGDGIQDQGFLSSSAHQAVPSTAALVRRLPGVPAIPGASGTAGFTSVIGRPQIAMPHIVTMVQPAERVTGTIRRVQPSRIRWMIPLAVGSIGLVVVLSGVSFVLRLAPMTKRAAVNAPITTLNAVIEGRLDAVRISPGSSVVGGQQLAHLINDRPDRSGLMALQANRSELQLAKKAIESEVAAADKRLADARVRRGELVTGLRRELEAQRPTLLAQLDARRAAAAAAAALTESPGADEAARRARVSADRVLGLAEDALLKVTQTLAGLDAGELPPDLPGAGVLASAEAELHGLGKRTVENAIASQKNEAAIAAEESRLATLAQGDVSAPSSGSVWRVNAVSGAWLKAGDPVITIADGNAVTIDAVFSEDRRDQLNVGDQVRVKITSSGRMVDGRITQIDPAANSPRAVVLPIHDGVHVEIGLANNIDLTVGSGAQVVVLGSAQPGLLRQISVWLREMVSM